MVWALYFALGLVKDQEMKKGILYYRLLNDCFWTSLEELYRRDNFQWQWTYRYLSLCLLDLIKFLTKNKGKRSYLGCVNF